MTDPRLIWQAASICLRYPVTADLELVRSLTPSFVDAALAHPSLEHHYVEVFDFTNRHSLYLTWFSDGDTRRRGASLVALKRRYAEAGLLLNDGELPDFLPTVLEYSARTGSRVALEEHHAGIATLHKALSKIDTIYTLPIAAVLATLPAVPATTPAPAPPVEMVGLS